MDVLVELCAVVDPDFAQLQQVVEGLTEYAVIYPWGISFWGWMNPVGIALDRAGSQAGHSPGRSEAAVASLLRPHHAEKEVPAVLTIRAAK